MVISVLYGICIARGIDPASFYEATEVERRRVCIASVLLENGLRWFQFKSLSVLCMFNRFRHVLSIQGVVGMSEQGRKPTNADVGLVERHN